jgi:hypothetical protein
MHSISPFTGQSTVQLVEDTRTHSKYAIKFFVSSGAFEKERDLYLDPNQPLGQFLPQLHSIAEKPEELLLDKHGCRMPPCIVMEKGEALDTWVKQCSNETNLDLVTGLQVIRFHFDCDTSTLRGNKGQAIRVFDIV